MNEAEALKRMVPPSRKRPGVWRGGIIQVMVTRRCDLSCHSCTQNSQLRGPYEDVPPDQFEQAVRSLEGYWGVIGLFGGNPALSKHFGAYCEILRSRVPYGQRGIWCNHPRGKGREMAGTFCPDVSNLNVHGINDAYVEFKRDWPTSKPFGPNYQGLDVRHKAMLRRDWPDRRGRTGDSRHSPTNVAMTDLDRLPNGANTQENRWELISRCPINQEWSALVGVVEGELLGYFCEIAYAQAALLGDPSTGVDVGKLYNVSGRAVRWWQLPMDYFARQARRHCHQCGVPLQGYGEMSQATDGKEQVSATYVDHFQPKRKGRPVEVVTQLVQIGVGKLSKQSTKYVENGKG